MLRPVNARGAAVVAAGGAGVDGGGAEGLFVPGPAQEPFTHPLAGPVVVVGDAVVVVVVGKVLTAQTHVCGVVVVVGGGGEGQVLTSTVPVTSEP
jgi:hypothetical protein